MRALLIMEGIGLLYCLFSWIRDHPKSKHEWVVSVGKRICRMAGRNRYRSVNAECCELIFPEASEEERKKQYLSLKVGGLLLWILLGNAVYLAAVYLDTPEAFPGIQLSRPMYGEQERRYRYQLSVYSENEVVTEDIEIIVPVKNPPEEVMEKQAEEAKQYLRTIFAQLENGISMKLPDSYQEIHFEYTTQNPECLQNDGEILWENVQKAKQVQMLIELKNEKWAFEDEMIIKMTLYPRKDSLQDTIQMIQTGLENGEYLTEDTLELPIEGVQGVQYQWSIQKDYSFVWMGVLWILVFPFLLSIMAEQGRKRKIRERKEKIRQRYPDMLNKLMILMGAGMSITKAWLKITEDYAIQKNRYNQKEPLYEEMLHAGLRLRNGYSMGEVIRVFAQRNSIREIQQFCGILQTGWKRGDSHILLHLKELHDRSWEIRKRTARKLSEEADTKLLLPLMLMLVVVMIIVLAPAMMTMKI